MKTSWFLLLVMIVATFVASCASDSQLTQKEKDRLAREQERAAQKQTQTQAKQMRTGTQGGQRDQGMMGTQRRGTR